MKTLFAFLFSIIVSFYAGQSLASSSGSGKPCPCNVDRNSAACKALTSPAVQRRVADALGRATKTKTSTTSSEAQ